MSSSSQASPGAVPYRVEITPVTPGIWRICFSVTVSYLLPYQRNVICINVTLLFGIDFVVSIIDNTEMHEKTIYCLKKSKNCFILNKWDVFPLL